MYHIIWRTPMFFPPCGDWWRYYFAPDVFKSLDVINWIPRFKLEECVRVCVCVWNKRHQLAVFLFLPWQTIITVQHLFFSENIIQPLFCWTFPCHKQTVETPKINISISPTFIFNLPLAKTPTQWHYPGSVLHNTQACNSIFPQPSAGADLMTVVLDRDIINNSPVGF